LEEIENWKQSSDRSDKTLQDMLRESRREYLDKKEGEKKTKPNIRRLMKNMKYGKSGTATKLGRSKKNTHSSTKQYLGDYIRSGNAARERQHYKKMEQFHDRLTKKSKNKNNKNSGNANNNNDNSRFVQNKNKKAKGSKNFQRPSKKQRWKQLLKQVGKA